MKNWTKEDFEKFEKDWETSRKKIRQIAVADIKNLETFSEILDSGNYSRLMLSPEEEMWLIREQENYHRYEY